VRQWAEYDWSPGRRPHLTTVLICDDPEDPPETALAAAREISGLGAGVRFEGPGNIIVVFGWG
jgi:hypothetical protein